MIRQFYVVFEIQIFKRVMLAVHLKNAYYNKNRYIYMSCDLYHSLKNTNYPRRWLLYHFKEDAKKYYCIVFWRLKLYGIL